MVDVRDLPMFTEDDIPDFSKLGAGNFSPAVEKAVTRIEVLASAAAEAVLRDGDYAKMQKIRGMANAASDHIWELMPNE